jgi:excisionase family DNA binding protein
MARTTTTPQRTEALLTVQDVARLDNCSVKTVRRAIDSGRLEAIRIGPGGKLLRISHEAHRRYRDGALR